MFDTVHEECGVFGIYSGDGSANVASDTYYALYALQHRGQESCGIAVNNDGVITCHRDSGLVNDVFNADIMKNFEPGGKMAMGHVRYGTKATKSRSNAQPLLVNHVKGAMALAYNGGITNGNEVRRELELSGAIFHSSGDAEVIAYEITKARLSSNSIEEAVGKMMNVIMGAYSLVIMSPSKLMAVRDPKGFHPLCIGKRGEDIIFASETCALDSIGAEFLRDVEPGEIVVVDKNGMRSIKDHCGKPSSLCVFEYIYNARPDSVIDGTAVHVARKRAGAFLAKEHPVDADVVIGVPDSGLDAAIGYAEESGIPYGIGFVKNKYIGRTFIQPTQKERENLVRIKLNVLGATVKGKRVVMIDDSIVRGTTSARIVKMLRDAGATEVHMRVSSPPFKHVCYYGTDIESEEVLIANRMTLDEIRDAIGADTLGFLNIENVRQIAGETSLGLCAACFDGKYPTEAPKFTEKPKFYCKISEGK